MIEHIPNIPGAGWILNKVINFLYEPAAENILDWVAIKKNRYLCKRELKLYVINKRITEHVILADGTLILYSKYFIEMLKNGNFELEKGYIAVNEYSNLTKIDKIYDSFKDVPKNRNRFKSYLAVCEIQDKVNRKTSVFNSKITNKTDEQLKYKIIYTNLKKGDNFTFCISITIPGEFKVKKEDKMLIKYNYGVYKFISKIDKQNLKAKKFSPICNFENKPKTPEDNSNIFYIGFKWKIRNPKKEGKIILKFN